MELTRELKRVLASERLGEVNEIVGGLGVWGAFFLGVLLGKRWGLGGGFGISDCTTA